MTNETNNNTLALLLIEKYAKSIHRLQELRNISYKSSVDSIFAAIAEAREMKLQASQMERDFRKVSHEYKESSGPVYRDWFARFCGQEWPLYFDISAQKEEITLTAIPRKFRAEYASNLASIGGTLDAITRSLAIMFGDENTNYETVLKEYFKPEARGTNDGKYTRLILPEIQALKDNGLNLKEWGAVAHILKTSNIATRDLCYGRSFDSWCREFLGLMGVQYKGGSVPRSKASEKEAGNNPKFNRLKRTLQRVMEDF